MVTEFPLDDPAGGVNTMLRTLADELRPTCRTIWLENEWDARRLTRRDVAGEIRYALRLPSPYNTRRPLYGFAAWAAGFPSSLAALRRLAATEAIDLAHLHYASPYQYIFRVSGRLSAIPYVMTLHRGDILSYPKLARPDRALVRAAIHGAAGVVAVSQWLAKEARAALGEVPALEVIENGIDLGNLDELSASDDADGDEVEIPDRFFLMVSNVARYKAQDVAIRAWAIVKERHPDLPLLIVGARRELWDECVRLIDSLGCGGIVRLLGPQPRPRALRLMRRAMALVIPSRSEGLPYVLLEAGALGTPVICSDIGPFTEVVTDGKTALVTPVEDHRALAQAALRLIETPGFARELGQRLSQRVRSDFSGARMAERYLNLYRRALERGRIQRE